MLKSLGVECDEKQEDVEGAAFHSDLLAAARALPEGTKATMPHVYLCSMIAIVTVCCWLGWLQGNIFALLVLPFFNWVLSVNVAHDAGHFAFSSSPIVNELLTLSSAPLMYDAGHWYLQHAVSHHCYTNEEGKDVDLSHFWPLARLHKQSLWNPLHYLQLLTVAAAFCSATVAETVVFPFCATCRKKQLGHTATVLGRTRVTSTLQLLASFSVLVAPFFMHDLSTAILFSTYPFVITSLLFMCITQISHVQEEVQPQRAPSQASTTVDGASGGMAMHWARRQVATSLDYSQGSWLVTFLTGGLNSQGLHHCLPFLSCSQLRTFYPTYRRICKKHGVTIHESRGFFDSLARFWGHMHALSKDF